MFFTVVVIIFLSLSCLSLRAHGVAGYRKNNKLPLQNLQMGVIVQQMVNTSSSGVVFSRNPLHPLDDENIIISSVWGLGEGLVGGELDADHFEVHRQSFASKANITQKTYALRQAAEGYVKKEVMTSEKQMEPSLTEQQQQEPKQWPFCGKC